ncbi:MAG: transglycosylase SLT domain-containing protein [Alphaproteobacteria bacterium]|uniref:Transglycosylase SLT domain-containing protein n=1 Tax=Candidatus Nitrobium versatile TaxID=2884831 RepID=A0A953JE01_9BACT|nr:transglycosylase SLT domain-containing protein [Candidatus Nitrobium versatile]
MKKNGVIGWSLVFAVLALLFGSSVCADTPGGNVSEVEKYPERSLKDGAQRLPSPPLALEVPSFYPNIAVTDLTLDKGAAAPAPESASGQTVKESPNNPGEKKEPSVNSPIDTASYKSNETALKAIERNVTLFTERIKGRFEIWLERSARYIEIMKEILREKQLPEELVFLPIVESGFNLNAYSPARAVGPWQFIAATAKRYGLVIDWWRDERKDPVKSTHAAAQYLKDLYKMFGSWNLALAAYNAGEGRISRALKKSDVSDYWSLLHTKQIRDETKEYVPRYIAATMIANTPEEYGFSNLDYHEPLAYEEITLASPMDIEVIAHCAESTVKEIRELNPELRRWSTPLNVPQYTIRIPQGSKELFLKNVSDIPQDKLFTVDTYTAKKGDTLKKIVRKTGVPMQAILAMNSLSGLEEIKAGYEIRVPPKEKFSPDHDDTYKVRKASYRKVSERSGKKISGKKSSGKKGKKNTAASTKKSRASASKSKSKVKTKKA